MTEHPLVAIPCDVKKVGIHPFHAVGEKYVNAVANGARCLPMLLPALSEGADMLPPGVDPAGLVQRFDGIFLPGSTSNVAPASYGRELAFAEEYLDLQRDAVTLALIRAAVDQGVPLLAICRGFQEMNVAFGGTLHQHVHAVEGFRDHREDTTLPRAEQYAPVHPVRLTPGGLLHRLANTDSVDVNSLHGQGLDRLGAGLVVEATAPDGLIEGIRVEQAESFALAVQWHAEWRYWEDGLSAALFKAFGDAVRARAAARSQ